MATLFKRGMTPDVEVMLINVAGPSSYATGGFDPGFPSSGVLLYAFGYTDANGKTTGYICMGDTVAKKVKAFWSGGAATAYPEVTAATNLSTFNFTIHCYWLP